MDIFGFLSLVGGLSLFLYGMHVMGGGLEKLSGGRLERILEKLTSNPLKAVLLGAGVTAVIQSSSATTVMLVGFVNSGIMKLSQAVGIIMGANIGTTITSWVLSLTGIESGNFFVRMLKPSSFTPILALVGIVFLLGAKSGRRKDLAEILLGFAVLMFGMEAMSGAVKPLADVPEFTGILTAFRNPVLGVLAGALLTAVIQSSSASVGILQALSVTGAFTYSSVIPIILGQNIGTCVTAMVSAVGANQGARRTAFVHLYFNLIGAVLFLAVYVFSFPRYQTEQVIMAFFGLFYVHVMLMYVYLTRMLDGGIYLVWLIVLGSWGSDTCAYCVGMLFGRHKMAPVLSPKKSVEGAIGGALGAMLLGMIYGAVFSERIPVEHAVLGCGIVCLVGAGISQIGDLAASAIKRNHNVKDYGKLIPGHGGILDRFDSVIFVAPAVYVTIRCVQYGEMYFPALFR